MCVSMLLVNRGKPNERFVPCGRCHECVSARINGWVFRLKQEQQNAFNSKFLSLTYDDRHVPFNFVEDFYFDDNDNIIEFKNHCYCFNKDHVKNFIHSLRDKIRNEGKNRNLSVDSIKKLNQRFKYFLVSEYGGESLRPHYHALLFNLPDFGFDWNEFIQKSWFYGNVHFGDVSDSSIIYCSGYLFKPMNVPEEWDKPFLLCSNGLGSCFLKPEMVKYLHDHVDDRFEVNGHVVKLPRYILEKVYPTLVLRLFGEKNLDENLDRVYNEVLIHGELEFIRVQSSLNEMKRKRFVKRKTKKKL